VDSLDLDVIRAGHADDTFVPVAPETFGERLEKAGFGSPRIDTGEYQFRFIARKP